MTWFKNAHDNYIFVDTRFGFLKRLWLMVNGYREVDTTLRNMSFMEDEDDEIYTFLKKRGHR